MNLNPEFLRGRIRRGKNFEEAISGDIFHRQIPINGESKTVKEWCDHFSLNAGSVYSRIHRGMTAHDAIMTNQDKIRKKENNND